MQSDEELLRYVAKSYSGLQRRMADRCGVTSTRCLVLCAIGEDGEAMQADLPARLGLEKSWVSRTLDGLEREGLVEREACCGDARRLSVRFTDAGRKRFSDLNASLNRQALDVLGRVPAGERENVRRSLGLLAEALSAMEDTPAPPCHPRASGSGSRREASR